MGVVKFQLFV